MRIFQILLIALTLMSCNEKKIVYINATKADCSGATTQQCLQYKENETDDWSLFYDTVEGFDYEEGYYYQIEVNIESVDNPPADGTNLKYSLVRVISKEKDPNYGINTNTQITYTAHSRGSYEKIFVTETFINIANGYQAKGTNHSLEKTQWSAIQESLDSINKEELATLKAPSNGRASDRAKHASLEIQSGNKSYKTNSFDHGNPPAEIKELIDAILSLSKTVEKR